MKSTPVNGITGVGEITGVDVDVGAIVGCVVEVGDAVGMEVAVGVCDGGGVLQAARNAQTHTTLKSALATQRHPRRGLLEMTVGKCVQVVTETSS